MKFKNLRLTEEDREVIEDVERQMRRLFPDEVRDQSAAIKKALRIALWYIKTTPFYEGKCDTDYDEHNSALAEKVYINRIHSDEINIDGTRKKKV